MLHNNNIVEILFGLIILFFILRPVWLWYFKIDESIKIQKEQLEELKKLNEKFSKNEN